MSYSERVKIATVNKETGTITALRDGNGFYEPDENHEHKLLVDGFTHLKVGDKFSSHGGAREGAGRKPKFKGEEETTTIAFRVPVSKADEIKAKIDKLLKPYLPKKQ